MQWENSGFVVIGSFCLLAQQAFLCIKHLKTEVLNNIFIFPLEIVFILLFLFEDNSPCFSIEFRCTFFDNRDRVSLRLSMCYGCGAAPFFWELLGFLRLQLVASITVG